MPYNELCCRSGGSNLNAGSLTGSSTEPGTSPSFIYASGSWVASTGVFTVASGNPSTDGVAVGNIASVYADGSTTTGFIGRVTAVSSSTITVSLTAKSGTAPTDGTSNRTLRIGGAFAGPSGASGFPFNFITSSLTNSSGHKPRVNFKNDQTYAVTATITATTSQNEVVFQGYSSNYGDSGRAVIDGGTTGSSYTLLNFAVNYLTVSSLEFCNNGATGNAHGVQSTANILWDRCVFHDFRGIGLFGGNANECEAYSCNKSNTGGWGGFWGNGVCSNCISYLNTGTSNWGYSSVTIAVNCIAHNNGGGGIAVLILAQNCDAYQNGSHGIQLSGASSIGKNCNVLKNSGYGIYGGIYGGAGHLVDTCGFGSGTEANTSGDVFGINNVINSVVYASNTHPYQSPATGDFRIALAAAKGAGRGRFLQTKSGYSGTVGYPDIGAAQHQDSGGTGTRSPFAAPAVFGA